MIFPDEDETGLRILFFSAPDRPVAGSIWTLTLLIDHHDPAEVNVLSPHFTGDLFLEHVLKSPRFINPGHNITSPERWTAMEYRFVLNSPGTISFDAFTVITPHGQTMTAPFSLNVQGPPNMAEGPARPSAGPPAWPHYRLVWRTPSELRTGENVVLTLRFSGGNYTGALPETGQFLPSVPPGHILEAIPLAPEEKSAGIALKLRLIPLEAAPFVLAGRQFSHNDAVFEIPALRIPVSQAAGKFSQSQAGRTAPDSPPPPPPFPSLDTAMKDHPRLYQKYQGECETMYEAARNLWETGQCAGALAALRRNERDHPAGALFATIRRGAESALGITGSNDEKRSLFRKISRSAVLRETAVRQIPDTAGEEIARFREGQPVLLYGKTQYKTWRQVIANDDNRTSGWVPEENIIFY